jgi:arabinose-5-phosphate isomerase
MITRDDVVIAISNSGETRELSDVIAFTRRYQIPLIAITGRGESTLAEAADVALVLPPSPEACPHGLAPTTSTTVAVALLEHKGFSATDFRMFHPGGKLGQRLLKVADLMHRDEALPLCDVGQTMAEALVEMTSKSFGCVGAVADGALVGIITDGDLRRHMAPDLTNKTVEASLLAAEALHVMNSRKVTSLFVVDDQAPVGILHIHDLLRAGIA